MLRIVNACGTLIHACTDARPKSATPGGEDSHSSLLKTIGVKLAADLLQKKVLTSGEVEKIEEVLLKYWERHLKTLSVIG